MDTVPRRRDGLAGLRIVHYVDALRELHMAPGYIIPYCILQHYTTYTIIYFAVLYCTVLYQAMLRCYAMIYYTLKTISLYVLYSIEYILYSIYYTIYYILYSTMIYYTLLCYAILYYTVLYHTILY